MSASPLSRSWQRLNPRERLGVGLAAAVVVLGLLLGGVVWPAWKRLQAAPAQQTRLDAQWQTMQALAAQAKALQGQPPRPRDERLKALETATRRHLGAGSSVKGANDDFTVQMQPTSPQAVAQWLADVRVNAQLTPNGVRLNRPTPAANGTPSAWQGTVQFNLGG
ncbi:type II secretion system protein GspM [Hydrogenophaga soli]